MIFYDNMTLLRYYKPINANVVSSSISSSAEASDKDISDKDKSFSSLSDKDLSFSFGVFLFLLFNKVNS